MSLEVRSEVLEYGSLPLAPWLTQIDSLQQIRGLVIQLLKSASYDDQGRGFVTPQAIAASLDTNASQTKVLLDLLCSLVEPADLVQRREGDQEVGCVEVYSLGLYLVAQFYLREAHKADTADMWPSELFSMQQEPSSPMHMTTRAWGKGDASVSHRAHVPMMRQHLQEHLTLQEALLQGFSGFLARHAQALVGLVLNPAPSLASPPQATTALAGPPSPASPLQPQQQQQHAQHGQQSPLHPRQPPASPRQQQLQQLGAGAEDPASPVSAAELDRLGFLLRSQLGRGGSLELARRLEGGSPMDVCCTPFTEFSGARLSETSPFFDGEAASGTVPLGDVASWLSDSLRQQEGDAGGSSSMMMSDAVPGSSPPAPPPGATSMFNQLVGNVSSGLGLPTDIQALSKGTVVRGEGDLPSGTLRIINCHDAVVYALAPLQYCLVSACSDCVIVVGAVGRAIRVERCERVQVIVAARSLTINTCHDCIFYLGVNQRPVVLGDNRFLQLAPYNAGYERLPEHMALAGVRPAPNLWDWPLSLQPDHRKHHHEQLHETSSSAAATPSPPHGLGSLAAAASGQQQQQGTPAVDGGPSPMVVSSSGGGGGGGGEAWAGGMPMPESPTAAAASSTPPNMKAFGGSPSLSEAAGEEPLASSPVLGTPASVTLLPPGKLLPFLVPFVGGSGPMCGGPAKVTINIRASSDSLAGFMSMPDGSTTFPSSPFALPPAYVSAWECKMKSAAEVRAAVKSANLDDTKKRELMSAIQNHFKDWLQQTGGMRQVYDLARMEREENNSQMMTGL